MRRRRLLQLAAAAAVAPRPAAAGFSPGFSLRPSLVITTLTVQNTSGSAITGDFVTQPIGLTFKDGDIAPGTYPQVQLTGGTPCPMNVDMITRYASGYMKHCTSPGIVVPNTSLAGPGSLTLNVLNNGSAPAATALSISNITARDLKVVLAGLTNLSGTWTASLNDQFEVKTIGSGPAGMCWRIMCHFKQSGSAHGQLECYFYVYAVQNSVGGLYRIRLMPAIAQPWYDINSPTTKAYRVCTATVQDGATVLQTMGPSPQSITTASGSASITATAHPFEQGMGVRLTAAPSGFSTGHSYGVNYLDANHIGLYDPEISLDSITAGSTTTTTATFILYSSQFTKHFGANADATYLSIQGGGSASTEPTVRVVQNKTYLRSTRQFPPYDIAATPITLSVPAGGSGSYYPNGHGYLDPVNTTSGGDHEYIGPLTSSSATRFILDTAAAEQINRVTALSMGEMWQNIRYSGTNTVPVLNNGSDGAGTPYPNMGGSLFPATNDSFTGFQFFWNGSSGQTGGFTTPAGIEAQFINLTTNHYPNYHYLEWMLTGEPQYADMVTDGASYLQMSRSVQRTDVGANVYYGTVLRDEGQTRVDAWSIRELTLAAYALPDAYWDGETKQYFTDCAKASFDSIVAYNATETTIWKDNGFYFFTIAQANCGAQTWQLSYLMESVAFAYGVSEYANALTFLNHLMKFPSGIKSNTGSLFSYTSYQFSCRSGGAPGDPVVSSMDEIHYAPGGTIAGGWSTDGSTTLSIGNNSGSPFTLTDGDRIQWWDISHGGAPPTGPALMTSYYARNVSDPGINSGKTCQIFTAPSGGSAIAMGADSGGFIGIRFQTVPASPTGLNFDDIGGHVANARCAFRFATAVGATLSGGILADMEGYFNNAGVTFNGNDTSKYCVVAAF